MKTPPDKKIAFSYFSHPVSDMKMRWRMTLAFPAGATGETPLALEVEDGEGTPISEGEMEIAGCRVAIRDGRGAFPFADFVAGKHETGIWLHRPGCEPVPGALTFA